MSKKFFSPWSSQLDLSWRDWQEARSKKQRIKQNIHIHCGQESTRVGARESRRLLHLCFWASDFPSPSLDNPVCKKGVITSA